MEFWGVEVKPGETLKVKPDLLKIIHISQASLGECKKVKGNATVPLRLKINDKSFVLGLLSTEDRPQMMVDLVFEKEFELSHDWKNGSVYFAGYSADDGTAEYSDDEDISSDEDLDLADGFPLKGEPQIKDASLDSDESGDSDAAEDSTDISSGDDEPLLEDDALENSSSDDESTKKKQSKKRLMESAPVLPTVAKKTKQPAPQKAGGKGFQAGKGPSPKDNKSKGKNGKAPFQKRKA